MKTNKKAYINNFASISCAGKNDLELFESICTKKDTLSLDSTYIESRIVTIGKINYDCDFSDLLFQKCEEVLKKSSLNDFSETLLVIGSSVGGMNITEKIYFKDKNYKNINHKLHAIDAISYQLNKKFDFYDDVSFSTACTSSANALGYAKEVISKNIYKNVLVIGIDALSHTTVCGFSALSVLSSESCAPFDKDRTGMNVSEAIAILLLQDEKIDNSIELCGVGYSSDGHHMTQPHPEGKGAQAAKKNAIEDANIKKTDIKYINAHGTGTMANDLSEIKAIDSLFEEHKPYICSTKSVTGHTLGAAGALEAIISCMVLINQKITPNKNLVNPEVENMNFPIVQKDINISYALSNSFAFGGNNTSLVFGLTK